MNVRKTSAILALGLILCIISAGCGLSSSPSPAHLTIMTTSLAGGTIGTAYSAPLSATGGRTPYTWTVASGILPAGLTLSTSGVIRGTPQVTAASQLTVQVTDSSAPTQTATVSLMLAIEGTVGVLTTTLPSGVVGTPYSATLGATGGQSPYQWSIAAGTLPAGLTLSSGGAISGIPTSAGTSNFTVQAADSEPTPATATAQLSVTVTTVMITTPSLPAGPVNVAYGAALGAVGGVQPYTWSVASGALPAGLTLSAAGVISGTPTATGTSAFTLQVADSESPPATDSAGFTISINRSGNTGALKGNYAFMGTGFAMENTLTAGIAGTQPWTVAGSFVADGQGNVTSGVVDVNSAAAVPLNTSIAGTYSVSSTGIGTLTLTGLALADMNGAYTITLAFSLSADGNGRIIEYDDTSGNGSRGAGVLRKQNPSAFSLGNISGGYAFGMTGADGPQRRVEAGQFTVDGAGNITDGTSDINDGGTFSTSSFAGTVPSVDSVTGRGTVDSTGSNGASHIVIYVVSPTEFLMMNDDAMQNGAPLQAGTALRQSGLFSNAALDGTVVLYYQDIHATDGANQSGAMMIAFDGQGNANTIAADENLAGTITQKSPSQATYTVSSNGAVSLAGAVAGFLVSPNRGIILGTGADSIFGQFEPQTGGPFSTASMEGSFPGGSLAPVDYANSRNDVYAEQSDGAGTLTLNDYSSSSDGLQQNFGTLVNLAIAANGRWATNGQTPAIFYLISPTRIIVLTPETGANLIVLEE